MTIVRVALAAALTLGVLAAPLTTDAQQAAKAYRIGVLLPFSPEHPETRATLDIFRQAMRELGYVEGRNIVLEYRSAEGNFERFPTLAAEFGLVASLARPGGNVTGSTFLGPELVPKLLELLKEAVPRVFRVAALWHPAAHGERTAQDMVKEAEGAARTLGVQLQLVKVGPQTISRARSPQ